MKRREYVSIVERHIGRPLDADETSFVHDTWKVDGGIYASRRNAINVAEALIGPPSTYTPVPPWHRVANLRGERS